VSEHRHHLRRMPTMAVADCMNIPLRSNSCDAAICIAVMHHLSSGTTHPVYFRTLQDCQDGWSDQNPSLGNGTARE
jgi:Methyltransferase domain